MGIWDNYRADFAERQRQKELKLQAELKKRDEQAQHFIDDFLLSKFKELINKYPDYGTLTISLRYCGRSYYTCTPPGKSFLSHNSAETEIPFDGTTIRDAFNKIRDNSELYELECVEIHDVGSCTYKFTLFLDNNTR